MFIRGNTFLRNFDPMIQETLTQRYIDAGVVIHKNHKGFKNVVEKKDDGERSRTLELVGVDGETTEVNELLWAIGRSPEIQRLDLAKIGVKQGARGHIQVDEFQNTNIEGIYALGYVHPRSSQAEINQHIDNHL